VGMYIMW